MDVGYLKKRNVAALVFAAGTVLVFIGGKNLPLKWAAIILIVCGWNAACWFYLRAKNRSGGWILLSALLGVLSPIVYYLLQDRSGGADMVKCEACGGQNFSDHDLCRYCKTSLAARTVSVINTPTVVHAGQDS